jgi:hypothetical protein
MGSKVTQTIDKKHGLIKKKTQDDIFSLVLRRWIIILTWVSQLNSLKPLLWS